MSRLPIFASLITVTASCTSSDEIWMPPSSSGKADGVSILDGSQIPSQYVDATKHYLTGRALQSLRDVGALTGVPEAVATRADGIIANLPPNGRLEAAELVRMEDPAIFASLFPEEQAALPLVWPHLVAPAGPAITASSPAGDLTVTPTRTEPGGLTPPPWLQISSLPTELQMVAKRVQLLFDADSTAATIQVADIESVIAMPQAFTPAEIAQLRQILAIFHERATSAADAKAVVPAPGHTLVSTTFGGLTLDLEADVVIREQRSSRTTQFAFDWRGHLELEQDLRATMTGGESVILIQLGAIAEDVLVGASAELTELAASEYIVERYSATGVRVEGHRAVMPAFKSGVTKTDITELADYDLILANNTPLIKNATATTVTPYGSTGSEYRAEFRYATTQQTNPNILTGVLDVLATPQLTLPPGRYRVPLPGHAPEYVLDLYPQNVVIGGLMSDDTVTYSRRLLFTTGYPQQKAFQGKIANDVVVFVPATNRLYTSWSGSAEVMVTAAMRVE